MATTKSVSRHRTAAPGEISAVVAPKTRLRKRLILVLKIVVSMALITVLVTKAGWSEIGSSLRTAKVGWLIPGFGLGVGAAMMQANQWRGLLIAFGLPTSFWRCMRLDTAARIFDAVLPSNIGGDVVRVGLASSSRSQALQGALAVGVRRVISIPGLILLLAIGSLASAHLPYSHKAVVIGTFGTIAGVVLGLIVAGLRAGQAIPLPRKIRTKIDDALAAGRQVSASGHPFWRAALRGLLFWCVVVLSQWCFIRAVGIHAPLEYGMVVVTAVNAVSMLPISLGGYGLREGVFASLLAVGGLGTTSQGVTVGVLLSLQTLAFGLIGGVVYLGLKRDVAAQQRSARVAVPGELDGVPAEVA